MTIGSRHRDRATVPGYHERRRAYLASSAEVTRDVRGRTAIFGEIARRVVGSPGEPEVIEDALTIIDSRIDCADFTLGGVLRLLRHPLSAARLSPSERTALERAATGFRYWWDQPGEDAMCFHTENHRALFHSAEMIAGQGHPNTTFRLTAMSGAEHRQHGEATLREWCLHRAQTGWSEWLSSTYIEHHLMALLNTYDFAQDSSLSALAGDLLDVMLVELALHSRDGALVASQGRIYPRTLRDSRDSGAASISWLLWGGEQEPDPCSVGTVALATSLYTPPAILEDLGRAEGPETIRARMSFDVEDAGELGVGESAEERARVFWALGEFGHPGVWSASADVCTRYGQRLDTPPEFYRQQYEQQVSEHGRIVDPHRDRHALSSVEVTTHRRPGATLSSAQVFRPGAPGYQQHVWQATLGPEAQVFSTAPGSLEDTDRPGWWNGNSLLPAAVQRDDLMVVTYRGLAHQKLAYSHVRWPENALDFSARAGSWWIGSLGQGLVGLWCSAECAEMDLTGPDDGAIELRTLSPDASWICFTSDVAAQRAPDQESALASFATQVQGMAPQQRLDGSIQLRDANGAALLVSWPGQVTIDGELQHPEPHPRLESPYGTAGRGESWILSSGTGRLTIPLAESIRGAAPAQSQWIGP
ncbi:hypothetical protein [Brachybacterium sp. AOP24-D1-21]|uniref:hypothetical protein n=1 Tax=Brachybacterium sp. AOP24-D1-21 TaxID=3457711 RepID=UPI0040349D17